jgi:hypothetical protein
MKTKYLIPTAVLICSVVFIWVFQSGHEELKAIDQQTTVASEQTPSTVTIDQVISQDVKQQVMSDVAIDDEMLKTYNEEFQEYYRDVIVPRIGELELHITSSSIQMIAPEVYVFWTEGLSPTAWGGHEFLYVISTESGAPKIVSSLQLDPKPSRTAGEYRKSVYWSNPNEDCGYNDFVKGILQYAAIGGSGSTFVQVYVEYNRYDDTYELNTTTSPVLFAEPECIGK